MWRIISILGLLYIVVTSWFSCNPVVISHPAEDVVFFSVDVGERKAELRSGGQEVQFHVPIKDVRPGVSLWAELRRPESVSDRLPLKANNTGGLSGGENLVSSTDPRILGGIAKDGYANVVVVVAGAKQPTLVADLPNWDPFSVVPSIVLGQEISSYYRETEGGGVTTAVAVAMRLILPPQPCIVFDQITNRDCPWVGEKETIRAPVTPQGPSFRILVRSGSSWIGSVCSSDTFPNPQQIAGSPNVSGMKYQADATFFVGKRPAGELIGVVCEVIDAAGQTARVNSTAEYQKGGAQLTKALPSAARWAGLNGSLPNPPEHTWFPVLGKSE